MKRLQNMTESDQAGVVVAVCISAGGVPKHPVDRVEVTLDGLVGDGHAHEKHCRPDRAVSVQDVELLEQLVAEGYEVGPGIMGENITVRGMDVQSLAPGDWLRFEGGPVLELASVRKPCYVLDAIHPDLKDAVVGRCGFLCRVVATGVFSAGQRVIVERNRPASD
jgi:MOSC domain-containing protein YiiM